MGRTRTARSARSCDRSIEGEVAHLRDLDLDGLRARWRAVFRKMAPKHLSRHLFFGMLAYRRRRTRPEPERQPIRPAQEYNNAGKERGSTGRQESTPACK
jgi:hypothetical protein